LEHEERLIPRTLGKIERATGVKRNHIVYGLASAVAVYLVLGHGAELLCNFIGFAYPAYASFVAIETSDKADDTQWLTYWTVFATISLVDFASDKIMGWFPIYWLAKCVFLLWLYLPITRGAEKLHTNVFGPGFKRVRPVLDGTASEVKASAQQAVVAEALNQQQLEPLRVPAEPVPGGANEQPPAIERPPPGIEPLPM